MAETDTNTTEDQKKSRPTINVPRGKLPTGLHHLKLMGDTDGGSVSRETLGLAKKWYTTLRFSALQSEADFADAWDCWNAALGLQGTIKEYREQLNTQAAGLRSRYQQWRGSQGIWTEDEINAKWQPICELLEQHLKPAVWKQIKDEMEGLFKGKPKK